MRSRKEALLHDLKGTIKVLRSILESLSAETDNSKKFQEYTKMAIQLAYAQEEYCERLTDLDGSDENGHKPVNIEEIVTNALIAHDAVFSRSSIRWDIVKNKDYKTPIIVGSRFDLKRMFNNIISNAIEASTSSLDIVIESSDNVDFIKIVIMDTGIGFDRNIVKSIFDRNNTERYSTKQGEGHGVGLQNVRSIIELHGGRVRAENRTDFRGAKIIITLPA